MGKVKWWTHLERNTTKSINMFTHQLELLNDLLLYKTPKTTQQIEELENRIDNAVVEAYEQGIILLAKRRVPTEVDLILTLLRMSELIEINSDLLIYCLDILREISTLPPQVVTPIEQNLSTLMDVYTRAVLPLEAEPQLIGDKSAVELLRLQAKQAIYRLVKEENLPRDETISLGVLSHHLQLMGDNTREIVWLKNRYFQLTKLVT